MNVYIAGPLFNDMERSRNKEIALLLESEGHTTYLPQRDGGVFSEMVASGKPLQEIRKTIFEDDITALKECDAVLCLLDGRALDEGMCIELGIAYTLKKKCLAYYTDDRLSSIEKMNIILEGVLDNVFTDKTDLVTHISSL